MMQRVVKDIPMINHTSQFGCPSARISNTQSGHCPHKGSVRRLLSELTLSHSMT